MVTDAVHAFLLLLQLLLGHADEVTYRHVDAVPPVVLGPVTTLPPEPAPPAPPAEPMDDDSDFDCRYHGNRICGPLIDLGDNVFIDQSGWVFTFAADFNTAIVTKCVDHAPCEQLPPMP